MRCGRGSKYMNMQGKCTGPKHLIFGVKMERATFGGHDVVRKLIEQAG